MKTNLEFYHEFIDYFVNLRDSINIRRIENNSLHQFDSDTNQFISSLNTTQKKQLISLLQSERDNALHSVLVFFNEELNNEMKILQKSNELPLEPYGTELFYDFVCRLNGDEWPK
jgi:hypothetical protein